MKNVISRDRESLTPGQLAEEVMRVVGDVDYNTAQTALEITRLLLAHRKTAEIEFLTSSS